MIVFIKFIQFYNLYASDENGNIIHVVKQVPYTGNKQKNGYLCHMVRKHGTKWTKGLLRS